MSDSSPVSDDEAITKISKNGDLILAVGSEKTRILVASDFLEHISPTFEKMIHSPFRHMLGVRNRTPDSPGTIFLSRDCPKTMEHLLRTLYGADHLELNFDEIYNMVALAGKYRMAERLKPFGAGWLRSYPFDKGPDDTRECWEKMVIAYLLGDDNSFFRMSRYLGTYGVELVEWALTLPSQEPGIKLALAIEQLRQLPVEQRSQKGLCIHCFTIAETSFVSRQHGCYTGLYHVFDKEEDENEDEDEEEEEQEVMDEDEDEQEVMDEDEDQDEGHNTFNL